jgi:hypothetical protein
MKLFIGITALLLFHGCATYIPPGEKADLRVFAPASVQQSFAAKPTAPFPASIASMRVQAPNYSNYNLSNRGGSFGTGRYSIVTTKEVEDPSQFDRLSQLPQVSGLVTLNRLLLPSKLESDIEVREAAAKLQADLIFLYTFDTAFFDIDVAKPLSVITLGLSPTRKINVTTTVSGLLMDTRSGFIYSAYEITTKAGTLSTSWGSRDAADESRQRSEREAFGKLIDDFAASWPKILDKHTKKG